MAREKWRRKYEAIVNKISGCKYCMDYRTCLRKERKANSGCEHYRTLREQRKKVNAYTMAWAVEQTGLTRQTVYNYIKNGLIIPKRTSSGFGNYIFTQEDLKKMLEIRMNKETIKNANLKQFKR